MRRDGAAPRAGIPAARAVTWTQSAQHVLLIVACLVPVIRLSIKHTGMPVSPLVYGKAQEQVAARAQSLIDDLKEQEVRAIFKAWASAAKANPANAKAYEAGKAKFAAAVEAAKAENAPDWIAAGGLAAALSTADGLLLTIANALSHELYYKMLDPNAPTARRVMISKILLLVVALAAAYVAAQKPADILFLVSAAFSFAAAAFFPALVCGIFWKRANKWGATLGMIAGLGITFYYMVTTQVWMREALLGIPRSAPVQLWWDIQPISAGLWGVPLGFLVIIVVSLLTPAPDRETQELVEHVRYPNLTGDTMQTLGT